MNRTAERPWWIRPALLYAGLALFFGWYAMGYFARHPLSLMARAAIYVCLLLLIGLALAPGIPELRQRLGERVVGWRGAAGAFLLFLIPYFIYGAGTGDFRWPALGKLAALAALPFTLFAFPVRRPERLGWRDAVVLLWLMLPVLFGLIGGIWNVPENLDFMIRLFLMGVALWSFLIERGTEGSGYDFRYSPAAVRDSLVNFLGFAVLAIPLGWELRFIAWNPQWHGVGGLLFDYLTIFLFIALFEELFFRGLLQNLLEGSMRSRYGGQALTAVIFGLSHLRRPPYPNWRYVAMATLAGWFYGSAYRGRRSLLASSVTHALVDTLWHTFLTAPR